MCGSQSVNINGCPIQPSGVEPRGLVVRGPSCTGDTYIRLFDTAGVQVAFNDDGCPPVGPPPPRVPGRPQPAIMRRSVCSSLTYTAPPSSPCQMYR